MKEDSDSVPRGAPWLPISAQADYAVTVLFKACPRGPKAMTLQASLYLEMWALAARGGRELGTTVHKQKTVSIYHWPPFSLRKKILGGRGRRRKCFGPHSLGTMVPLSKGEQVPIFCWENYLSLTKQKKSFINRK